MANEWKSVRLEDVAEVLLGKMLDQKKNKGTYLPYLAEHPRVPAPEEYGGTLQVKAWLFDLDDVANN
ncbi:MAG: hypothetical protein GX564_00760 [Oligosphaeraceae bacterium]|nr:hypothetical protein [Oligosphaeraceae bacterium]